MQATTRLIEAHFGDELTDGAARRPAHDVCHVRAVATERSCNIVERERSERTAGNERYGARRKIDGLPAIVGDARRVCSQLLQRERDETFGTKRRAALRVGELTEELHHEIAARRGNRNAWKRAVRHALDGDEHRPESLAV